uniref:PAX-interacting protein 1 n=1 Tax=Setaria digitata TaxID=48799 RepID=A0A915PVT9_9BILA
MPASCWYQYVLLSLMNSRIVVRNLYSCPHRSTVAVYPAPNPAPANQQSNLQPQQYSPADLSREACGKNCGERRVIVPLFSNESNLPMSKNWASVFDAKIKGQVQQLKIVLETRYSAPGAVQSQAPAAPINPCYQAPSGHDMRSPQLMSPTQASVPGAVSQATGGGLTPPVVNNTALQRVDMQPSGSPAVSSPHIRMVQQAAPFYGHDPNVAGSVQSDMCLVGCFFVVIEHEKVLVDRLDVQEIGAVVRLHGGEIEFGARAYNNVSSDRVTHVICESMRHPLVQQALKRGKRCITLHWLNDVLTKKHLEAPWRVFHLPTFWMDNHRPAAGKIIAINGFNESERCGVRMMITAIGARYTPHLTNHNHYLVTKTCEGEKIERCHEMGIPVVTYQWLVEIYLGIKNTVNENENCSPVPGMVSDTNTTPYNMEHYSEACKQFLFPWKIPILFANEQWQRAMEVKRSVENDKNIFPNKRLRMTTPPPTDEEIERRRSEMGALKEVPVVCFSGFTPEEKSALGRKVRFLGGIITDKVPECTHLVVVNLWRTLKLLEAIALGKNVVGPDWITDGYRCHIIPDSLDYFVRDDENEKIFGYNLKYSILKARYRKLFQDVTFYLTPSVEPSYEELLALIELAGGTVLRERPQPQYVIQCIETESLLLLIGNDSDVHLLQYLTDCGMPVHNVEIILTGILRQKLENSPLYRVPPIRPPLQPISAQPLSTKNTQQNTSQRVTA